MYVVCSVSLNCQTSNSGIISQRVKVAIGDPLHPVRDTNANAFLFRANKEVKKNDPSAKANNLSSIPGSPNLKQYVQFIPFYFLVLRYHILLRMHVARPQQTISIMIINSSFCCRILTERGQSTDVLTALSTGSPLHKVSIFT